MFLFVDWSLFVVQEYEKKPARGMNDSNNMPTGHYPRANVGAHGQLAAVGRVGEEGAQFLLHAGIGVARSKRLFQVLYRGRGRGAGAALLAATAAFAGSSTESTCLVKTTVT